MYIEDLEYRMIFPKLWPLKMLNKQKKISEIASDWRSNAISMEFNYMEPMDILLMNFCVLNLTNEQTNTEDLHKIDADSLYN